MKMVKIIPDTLLCHIYLSRLAFLQKHHRDKLRVSSVQMIANCQLTDEVFPLRLEGLGSVPSSWELGKV